MAPSLGGSIELRVNAVVRNVPVADHKRVQSNGLYPQHGGMMMSMHKVYSNLSFECIYLAVSLIYVFFPIAYHQTEYLLVTVKILPSYKANINVIKDLSVNSYKIY